MSDAGPIAIHPLSGPSRAWLHLQGTILIYRERRWVGESCLEIPVELLSFSEGRAFQGSRLIVALLSILFVPALGFAVHAMWALVAGPPSPAFGSTLAASAAVATFVAFLVLLGRFLVRQKTMTLHVAPDAMALSLWMDGRSEAELRRLADDVRARQAMVTETVAFPLRDSVGEMIHRPWRRLVLLTFLFTVPALITENPWLLFVGLVPIGLHAVARLRASREPREYRDAVRLFHRREWTGSLDLIEGLLRSRPDHRPSLLLRIELLLRMADFTAAEDALARIHDEVDSATLQVIQQDIILRRRLWERKRATRQPASPNGMHPSQT